MEFFRTLLSSDSSNGKNGSEWKSKVYFDPESDISSGSDYFLSDAELRTRLEELIDCNEEIRKIWVYSHPLYDWQIMEGLMYHAFIVLETDQWWWSIEKNDEGITIQHSKYLEFVKERYRREKRTTPINERKHDSGRMKMLDLVNWLYEKDELNQGYRFDIRHFNCQGFAKRVFDHFAKEKFWYGI